MLVLWILAWTACLLTADAQTAGSGPHLRFESDPPDRFIVYRGFVVKIDCALRGPQFTIHCLSPEQIDPHRGPLAKRRAGFVADTAVASQCQAANADYKKSGFNKGHLTPAADFTWDKQLKDETFVLTNVSPQWPRMNSGPWAHLEASIREQVLTLKDTAWVVTGVLFDALAPPRIGPHGVAVPRWFYKAVYFPVRKTMFGFLMRNEDEPTTLPLQSYQVSIDSLESLAGEDFFDRVDDGEEAKMESRLEHWKE